MRPSTTLARAAALAALLLSGCLETEETITVHEDGSFTVELSVEGHAWDLLDGHPAPSGPPWQGLDAATVHWMDAAAAGELTAWYARIGAGDETTVELNMRAEVDDAAALPAGFAPPGEPYGDAFQQRLTTLRVERKPNRTVYVLERVLPGRNPIFGPEDEAMIARMAALPQDVGEKLQDQEPLTEDEWQVFVDALADVYRDGARIVAHDALVALYTRGDASLRVGAMERIELVVAERTASALSIQPFVEAQERERAGRDRPGDEDPLDTVDRAARQALRDALAVQLDAEGVPFDVRNATLEHAERFLASWDQATDLRDEAFAVHVEMPGVIIDSNADEVGGGRASWEFDGGALVAGDVALRVVSVVE